MYSDTKVLLAFVAALVVFSLICGQCTKKHELGWLAQKQIQARQDCEELIKYRMRW